MNILSDLDKKKEFLKITFPNLLRKAPNSIQPYWGNLSYQGMVEHMAESIDMAYGKVKYPVQVDDATMEKVRQFMLSEKPFRPGTTNSIMGNSPPPLRHSSLQEALWELDASLENFISFYEKNPHHREMNPFFGLLDASQWIHLLHKHARHHLNQFGLLNDPEYAPYLRNSAG